MNQTFEENINIIIHILKNRIKTINILTSFIFVIAVIFTILFSSYITYIIFIYILSLLTFCIQFLFKYMIKKLKELLETYQIDTQEVIDYIDIEIRNAKNHEHHFIMKTHYKNIMNHYIQALEALKNK